MQDLANAVHTEDRKFDRFYIRDQRCWSLTVNQRRFPVNWIKDLNSLGMQLMVEARQAPVVGEKMSIYLGLMGSDLIRCQGRVKWVRKDPREMNMQVFGLEFDDPYCRIAKSWQEKRVKSHVARSPVSEISYSQILAKRPAASVPSVYLLSALIFFALGFTWSLY